MSRGPAYPLGRGAPVALGLAAGALVTRWLSASPRPGFPYFAGAPLLMAHRGGAALAPENTLTAFQQAVEWWGADVLELDVQATRDGEAVVLHDDTLERTTDGSGAVREHTVEELRRLDAGFRFSPDGGRSFPYRGRGVQVPTLAEVLTALPGVRLTVEVKDGAAQERVWEAVAAAGAAQRVLIASGERANRARFAEYAGPQSAAEEELRAFYLYHRLHLAALFRSPVDAFQMPERHEGRAVLTPRLVREAHAKNIAVHVWTVDDARDMRRLLDWGVDGIVTDRPDRLARVLHERAGRPLPPGPPASGAPSFLERLLRA